MRWQHGVIGAASFALWFMACSGGAQPIEDDGGSFGGGVEREPDITARCEEQCAPLHSAGEADYRASRSCVLCDACYVVCENEGVDLSACPNEPTTDGCSANHFTCAECVAGTCAQFQDPATTEWSGLCAAQGTTCFDNVECVALTNCVRSCVESSTPPPM